MLIWRTQSITDNHNCLSRILWEFYSGMIIIQWKLLARIMALRCSWIVVCVRVRFYMTTRIWESAMPCGSTEETGPWNMMTIFPITTPVTNTGLFTIRNLCLKKKTVLQFQRECSIFPLTTVPSRISHSLTGIVNVELPPNILFPGIFLAIKQG